MNFIKHQPIKDLDNKGIGTEINNEKEFDLYIIAAEKENNNHAQKSLAFLYEQEKSLDKAIYWYKKAIENGCQEAKENLSVLLKQQKNYLERYLGSNKRAPLNLYY